MAQIYDALGKSARAQTLREKAEALFVRFNECSGMKGPASTLSVSMAKKAGVERSFQSWPMPVVGIVPPDRAAKVVKRLMEPDMWSGWGIRTL